MVRHGEWEVCTHTPVQSVLLSQLLADPQGKDFLGGQMYLSLSPWWMNSMGKVWVAHYN